MKELLVVALVVACPLMMMMMRGHGHSGHGHGQRREPGESPADLRRRREELDRLIEDRERSEREMSSVRRS